jgi:predicted permease
MTRDGRHDVRNPSLDPKESRKTQAENRLDTELRFHYETMVAELEASGLSREEARRRARLEFGGHEGVKQRCREARRAHIFEVFVQDLRFALRTMRRSPGLTAVVILTLGLGIGANTALFSIVNGVLLTPLPVPHPDELVILFESQPHFEQGSISYPNFLDWQRMNRSFRQMAGYRSDQAIWTGDRTAGERLVLNMVSWNFMSIFGVQPILGRNFVPEDDRLGAAAVVLVSHHFWSDELGADPQIVGRPLLLNGKPFVVAGVLPPSFNLHFWNFPDGDVFRPIGSWEEDGFRDRAHGYGMNAVGRLAPGVALDQARRDFALISTNLERAYPYVNKGTAASLKSLPEQMVAAIRPFLLLLLAAVGLVLLIACANVANLLLARAASRGREFAIRIALGAQRRRLLRQLVTESVVFGLAGGLFGLLLASSLTRIALHASPEVIPNADAIALDGRVLMFALGVSFLCGLVFGLVPALRTTRSAVHADIKEGGLKSHPASGRLQHALVVLEFATALVLLIGAGLMLRSFDRLLHVDPGFRPKGVLVAGVALPPHSATDSPAAIRAAFHQLTTDLEATPGVDQAALHGGAFPMRGDSELQFWVEGDPHPAAAHDLPSSIEYDVEPHYFPAMGVPLRRGRLFTAHDTASSPTVCAIDEDFARIHFRNREPLGQILHIVDTPDRRCEVVGVVGHVKQWGLDGDSAPEALHAQVYLALDQMPDWFWPRAAKGLRLVTRTATNDPLTLVPALKQAAQRSQKGRMLFRPVTMEVVVERNSLAGRRFVAGLFGVFALLALLLAAVGIYGVISYLVGRRTHEMAVRIALGASQPEVLGLVLREGGRMALWGTVIGSTVSLMLAPLLRTMLFGVAPIDPVTFLTVPLVLTAVALLACYVPARRAMRTQPTLALRAE